MMQFAAMDYSARRRRLAEAVARRRLGALLVTHPPNVQYLCGFTGSSAVLIAGVAQPLLITDGRYTEQAQAEVQDVRVAISKGALLTEAARRLERLKLAAIGIEADHISAALRAAFRRLLPPRIRLRDTSAVVEQLRVVKEPAEVERIRAAVLTASSLFEPLLKVIRPGAAETTVAGELEFAARRAGAEGMSFETIVASGVRSALPHGRASAAPVPERGFVILDYGVRIAGYCSDMTRTVHVGTPDRRARSIYDAVLAAQQAATEAVKPGVAVQDVDRAARTVLQRAGLGRYFTHSTGHGVGLEIHEAPRLARSQPEELRPGMIVTIEPGAYISGFGGVRIEDMVRVTGTGYEVLTPTSRELIVL